jgi:hypothetical protein
LQQRVVPGLAAAQEAASGAAAHVPAERWRVAQLCPALIVRGLILVQVLVLLLLLLVIHGVNNDAILWHRVACVRA